MKGVQDEKHNEDMMDNEFPLHHRSQTNNAESFCSIAGICKKGIPKRREGWYGRVSSRVRFPRHLQQITRKRTLTRKGENMENYIMTSVEIDMDFVDRMSDDYAYQMSDEEQKGFEEHITDEEIEPCGDIAIDNSFNSLFGKTIKETKSIRRATKKAQQVVIPTYKGVVSRIEENTNRLANHFNHQGVK